MHYLKMDLADLPGDVGVTEADGSRSSDGRTGYLSYGPYLSLAPGRYFGGFHIRLSSEEAADVTLSLDVARAGDPLAIEARDISATDLLPHVASLVGLEFVLSEPCEGFELRLHVTANARINVTSLKIFEI